MNFQYWVKWPVLFLFCLVHGDALSSVSPSEIRSLGSPRFLAFSSFILKKQTEILKLLEAADGSGAVATRGHGDQTSVSTATFGRGDQARASIGTFGHGDKAGAVEWCPQTDY